MLTRVGLVLISVAALASAGWIAFGRLAESGESPAKKIQDVMDAEAAKPRFTGSMGDFLVYSQVGSPPAEANIFSCDGRGTTPVPLDDALRSQELWPAAFVDGGGAACEGKGLILVSNADKDGGHQSGDGSLLIRGYLRSLPVPVVVDAPNDRLELITVEGHPGLLEHEIIGYPYAHASLVVLERPPESDKPGIVVYVEFAPSADAAIRHAEEIMP